MQAVSRVERHVIRKSDPVFMLLSGFCHKSKNLYNHANYVMRQEYIRSGKVILYGNLDKMLKQDVQYPDYKAMPTARAAQQVLRSLCRAWHVFMRSRSGYSVNPGKYHGRPRMPGYLNKSGGYVLFLTNQDCVLRDDGRISFPAVFNGFSVRPLFVGRSDFKSFQQVRILPRHDRVIIELVYNVRVPDEKRDNGRYVGIDIGLNNLAVVVNNMHAPAFAINGRPFKSMDLYYEKLLNECRSEAGLSRWSPFTRRMCRIRDKRNAKINDYLHKTSRYIVDYCVKYDVSKIIIGKNGALRYMPAFSARLIDMISYKAKMYGIAVIVTEESYTSGTSFVDDEHPVKYNYDKTRRVHRGLFVSNGGVQVNADVNAAYQIMRKVVPVKWDIGCSLHPEIVSIA